MKKIIFFVLLNLTVGATAKTNTKVYYESIPNGYAIYVDNLEYCPVSVVIRFNLENLKATTGRQNTFIIPPQQKRFKITDLKAIRGGKYAFSYKNTVHLGDINIVAFDQNYIYDLPYAKGQSFTIYQGYDSDFTHKNKKALDFSLPIGTAVHTVRSGVVVKVIDTYNKHCASSDCAKYNNYILIQHKDGTFANYSHLKQASVIVKMGDTIKKGELLALSGNTGWTSGPHLHLEIYLPKANNRRTLATKFRVNKGDEVLFLKQKNTYKKEY